MEQAQRYTLGKNERLKSRKQIEQLFKEGKTFSVSPLRVYYSFDIDLKKEDTTSVLQFGVGVSTRNFKKAVDRNRIKRLLREAYRLQKNELKDKVTEKKIQLNLFIIYTGRELPAYNLIFEKVTVVLQKVTNITDESAEANS
ncbi:MAG: ribonuclease P protein component [Lacibacter sp.]